VSRFTTVFILLQGAVNSRVASLDRITQIGASFPSRTGSAMVGNDAAPVRPSLISLSAFFLRQGVNDCLAQSQQFGIADVERLFVRSHVKFSFRKVFAFQRRSTRSRKATVIALKMNSSCMRNLRCLLPRSNRHRELILMSAPNVKSGTLTAGTALSIDKVKMDDSHFSGGLGRKPV
jgi:hypothetical protein